MLPLEMEVENGEVVGHTGARICRHMEDMLEQFGVRKEKVHVIIRDQGSNMVKVRFVHDYCC